MRIRDNRRMQENPETATAVPVENPAPARFDTLPLDAKLLRAVAEHADGYVRYRALVLLTGFNDPRTRDAMVESLTDADVKKRFASAGTDVRSSTPEEYSSFIRSEIAKWTKLAQQLGLKQE